MNAAPKQFFYQIDSTIIGPVTGIELRDAALTGIVIPTTSVASNPDGEWVAANRIQGLFDEKGRPLPHPLETQQNPASANSPRTSAALEVATGSAFESEQSPAAVEPSTESSAPQTSRSDPSSPAFSRTEVDTGESEPVSATSEAEAKLPRDPLPWIMIAIPVLVLAVLVWWFGILQFIRGTLWLILDVSVVAGVALLISEKTDLWFRSLDKDEKKRLGIASVGVAAVMAIVLFCLPVPQVAIETDNLALASMTVFGQCTESDLLDDDNLQWIGSAFVYQRNGDLLYMYTNAHCLGLDALVQYAAMEIDGSIEISGFHLSVGFPSGEVRPVKRMAIDVTGKDIARLEVSASRLVEGKDYVVIPFAGSTHHLGVKPGDDVIAVGSPIDPELQGTQTFGHVSALRPENQSLWIQHDAPISHGNSGGPLFLKRGKKLHWVGINTKGNFRGHSLGFALSCQDAVEGDYLWADATPAGAANVFTNFGISATVVE